MRATSHMKTTYLIGKSALLLFIFKDPIITAVTKKKVAINNRRGFSLALK